MTPEIQARIIQALRWAVELHPGQKRKGSEVPYLSHLLGVASIAMEYGADVDETIGALLHDAVEDAGGLPTLMRIREEFGPRVAQIVEGCTDSHSTPKPPWRERKERYLAHLEESSPSVRLVSASDKLHNAGSILRDYRRMGEAVWERFSGGRMGTLWYYRSLVLAFRRIGLPSVALLEELDRTVTELERLVAARG